MQKKPKSSKKKIDGDVELDGVYFLKIVLYFVLGCLWVRVGDVALPVGLALGLVFATHDHFKIDRKIEVVVLLFAAMLSFFLPIGFVLNIA